LWIIEDIDRLAPTVELVYPIGQLVGGPGLGGAQASLGEYRSRLGLHAAMGQSGPHPEPGVDLRR